MNREDLYAAIGNVDDGILEKADRDNQKKKVRPFIPIAAAAIFALAVGIPTFLFLGGGDDRSLLSGGPETASENLTMDGPVIVVDDIDIYYCDENFEVTKTKKTVTWSVPEIFGAWLELNGIGKEVTLTRTRYEDNGQEYNDGSVAQYTVPTYFEYEYALSADIEPYLNDSNRDAVIESLQKTLYNYLIGDRDGELEIKIA